MNINIENLNQYVQQVSYTANYWLVRTMSGHYYRDFVGEGYIAIGHNEISLNYLRSLNEDDKLAFAELKGYIVEHLESTINQPGHAASQLIRFSRHILPGDIVVVPGYSFGDIAICRVSGCIYEEPTAGHGDHDCPFMKRIPVRVERRMRRRLLPPKAQLMFNSRHPISDINAYAAYIDTAVHDYYNKGDETHLLLQINTDDEVAASTFYNLEKLFQLAENFCQEYGIEGNASDVAMKVQMESKGWLRFVSRNAKYVGIVASFILFINGGGFRYEREGLNVDLSTDGLFRNISEFLDRQQDREMKEAIKNSLDSLEIKTPEDFEKAVIELYRTQNEARDRY